MNGEIKMTPKEIIGVLVAFEEGKEIEFLGKHTNSKWRTVEKPCWNFDLFDYRVKQQDKVLYQWLIYNSTMNIYLTTTRFFENETELQSDLTSNHKIIQRLDFTRVTIKQE